MNLSDFYIGLEFTAGPFWWRCTDVGTRTVVAVRLVEEDLIWYKGPPYMVEEVVLDEKQIASCHLTQDNNIQEALLEADVSEHPGYPSDAVTHMMRFRLEGQAYPRRKLLRFDRVRADGEILHPFAARQDSEDWVIRLYLPFPQAYHEMPEKEFVALQISTAMDVRNRADRRQQHGSDMSHVVNNCPFKNEKAAIPFFSNNRGPLNAV